VTNGGGPATKNGKQIVRWNATRHGISSPQPVIPGLEEQADWESHRDGIMENLSPVGHLEVTLAERVALLSWRLHRVTRYETQSIAVSQEQVEEDIHRMARLLRSLDENPYASTHPEDIRFEAKHYKQAYSVLRRFPSLDADKTLKGADASSVVWGVLMEAKKAVEEEIDEEALDLPGVPEDAAIEELPAMKVADVRGCVEAIAAHVSLDPDDLLELATYEADGKARSAAHKKEDMEQEISRKVRERILPDAKTLEKITRYEAHLSRQLFHCLHELENLQKHRTTGDGVPLLRMDVQGSISPES
jgi:DNA gyrase/topoisomerase IV subunit A